jgi:hypothetical protein
MKIKSRYGISTADGFEILFSNELDRNEMVLAIYEDWVYNWWNQIINQYDYDEDEYDWEIKCTEDNVAESINVYQEIIVEE